jgi:amino acid transporter
VRAIAEDDLGPGSAVSGAIGAGAAGDARGGAKLIRVIGGWGVAALTVNTVVGGGIFGLPAGVAHLLGAWSPVAFAIAAGGNLVVVAAFAEVGSRFSAAGGPYLYTRRAFGGLAALQVGWLGWCAGIATGGANANLLVTYGSALWPGADSFRPWLLVAILGGLGVVNLLGVRGSTHLCTFLTVAKLVPLVALVALGLIHLARAGGIGAPTIPPPGPAMWGDAFLLTVYAYSGFQTAGFLSGEIRQPRRDLPFGLGVGMLGVAFLFTALQVIVVAVLPDAGEAARPLVEVARRLAGPGAAGALLVGALLAIFGNLSTTALAAPRFTFALAEQGDFPRAMAWVHPRFRTPAVSIAFFTIGSMGMALAGGFVWNARLVAVARLLQYVAVCAALPVLRRRFPDEDALRMPGGVAVGWLGAILAGGLLLATLNRVDLAILALAAIAAAVNWVTVTRRPAGGPP